MSRTRRMLNKKIKAKLGHEDCFVKVVFVSDFLLPILNVPTSTTITDREILTCVQDPLELKSKPANTYSDINNIYSAKVILI